GIVNNQTLAYFIGRVYLFLTRLGIDEKRLRFRQHLPNEMAHYAADCWDAEIESSYGWIECVGIADRSAYDLRAHTDKSGVALVAQEKFAEPEPKEVEEVLITPNKKELGLAFKGTRRWLLNHSSSPVNVKIFNIMNFPWNVKIFDTMDFPWNVKIFFCDEDLGIRKSCGFKPYSHPNGWVKTAWAYSVAMNENERMEMKATLESKGEVEFEVCKLQKTVTIKENMVSISKETKKEHQRTFTPSVIEPSFGVGRIIYCLYEHSFYTRPSKAGDEQVNVFRFPPLVAPIKCTVFPLVKNEHYEDVAKRISRSLTEAGISNKKDITGTSIGKKYARTDELGVPFAVTVDSTTSVTIRERDSKDQIRVKVDKVAAVVKELCEGRTTWADMLQKYPAHTSAYAKCFRLLFYPCSFLLLCTLGWYVKTRN
ncbi:glycine--tRNA ligase, mitochondrial 1, partial [Tanacetum coccineum]